MVRCFLGWCSLGFGVRGAGGLGELVVEVGEFRRSAKQRRVPA